MKKLYEEYEESLKISKKTLRKRQKENAEIREKYKEPHSRPDHAKNVADITEWNKMISELETDMKDMEMYLDFCDRKLLHRDYDNMKSMIRNQNSYEGYDAGTDMYKEFSCDVLDLVCDVEMQEDIVGLLDKVLTERQRQVVDMRFFENKTQEQIARELGITKQAISLILQNSIEMLRECIKNSDLLDF